MAASSDGYDYDILCDNTWSDCAFHPYIIIRFNVRLITYLPILLYLRRFELNVRAQLY